MLKSFAEDGRDLTDAETKAFLNAADKDGDGKIGIDGERGGRMTTKLNPDSFPEDLNVLLFFSFPEFEVLVHEV